MADPVKARRRYDSPRRREQAAATRAQILEAAERLFGRDGYVATTMAAVAAEAGVALKTVYLAFDTKPGLLRAIWDLRLRGPVDQPVADLPWYREVLEEPDPVRQLQLNARNSRNGKERIGGLLRVIRDAAGADADMAALWHLIETDFYANQQVIVEVLALHGALRPGLDVTTATDACGRSTTPTSGGCSSRSGGGRPTSTSGGSRATACEQLLGPRRGHRPLSGPRRRSGLAGRPRDGVVLIGEGQPLHLARHHPAEHRDDVLHPVVVAHQRSALPSSEVAEAELGVEPSSAGRVAREAIAEHVDEAHLAVGRGTVDRGHQDVAVVRRHPPRRSPRSR